MRKPLKRKKKIKRKNGSEFVVTCKYERLGDFCFACGLVTHTERFCRRSIDNRSDGGSKDWGTWLRAPSRRGAGQGGSKWLRDETDAEWSAKIGGENNVANSSGANQGGKELAVTEIRENRSDDRANLNKQNSNLMTVDKSLGLGLPAYKAISNGLDTEENNGLEIEDRKRRRSGSETHNIMNVEGVLSEVEPQGNLYQHKEIAFSEMDYAVPTVSALATPAKQASQAL